MMIPANRRNPVRNAVEGALALTSAAIRAARNIQPLVSGATQIVQAVRGRKKNRRATGNVSMSMRQAPVTQGFSFGANSQSIPKACSFGGMKGVCFSGIQGWCLVQSAAATTDPALIFGDDTIASAVNGFYDTVPLRLGTASQNATGMTKNNCYIIALDPLQTQFALYRKFRIKKLGFVYIPKVGSNTTTQIALAFSPSFTNYQTANTGSAGYTVSFLEQYECSTSFPSWESGYLDCTPYIPKDRLMSTNADYPASSSFSSIGAAAEWSPSDLAPGTLMGAIDGSTVGVVYGRLMMKYEIEFYYRGPYCDVDTATLPPQPKFSRSGGDSKVHEPLEEKGDGVYDSHFDHLANDDIVCVASCKDKVPATGASNTRAKSAPVGGVPRT